MYKSDEICHYNFDLCLCTYNNLWAGHFFSRVPIWSIFQRCEIIYEKFKGSKKNAENLRGLKSLDVAEFKGAKFSWNIR